MELIFDSTKKFEKEISKFQGKDKSRIIEKINTYCSLLQERPQDFYKQAYKPLIVNLQGEQAASLYTLKINRDIRVILTVDDDPIFDQTIITLLHVVRHSSLEKVFKGIAESLYQNHIASITHRGNK